MIGRMSRFDWLARFFLPVFCAAPRAKREKRPPACPPRRRVFSVPGWVFGITMPMLMEFGPANTKSEARALLKRQLGRIPSGTTARPVEDKAAA